MPIHKDSIKNIVSNSLKSYGGNVPQEDFAKAVSSAIYAVLNSREFEDYVKEIAKR